MFGYNRLRSLAGDFCLCIRSPRLQHFDLSFQQAEAQLAYQLQAAKEKQKIRKEEIEIEVVQRRKQIDVEAREIERKDRELEATVRRPTEAEAYKVKTLAEGRR